MNFTIDQGKKAIFSFYLFNNTKTILSVDKIYPGCAACTKILSVSNKELKPYQRSEILFSFQKRTHGKFNYIIWISEKKSLVEPLELELWITVRKAYDVSGVFIENYQNIDYNINRVLKIDIVGINNFDNAILAKSVVVANQDKRAAPIKLLDFKITPTDKGKFLSSVWISLPKGSSNKGRRIILKFDNILELEYKVK